MVAKRKPLTESSFEDDFDPQAVEQLRQSLNIPTVSPNSVSPLPEAQPAEQPKAETKRLNVDIPLDLHRWLKSYSGREGRSITDIVIDLLIALRKKE